jgi:hypothetical protein
VAVNIAQAAAFKKLKVSGLLCSKYWRAIEKGQRYFTLVEAEDRPTRKGEEKTVP